MATELEKQGEYRNQVFLARCPLWFPKTIKNNR